MHVNGTYVSYTAKNDDVMGANPQAAVTLGLVNAINTEARGVKAGTPSTKTVNGTESVDQSVRGVFSSAGVAEEQEISFNQQVFEIATERSIIAQSTNPNTNPSVAHFSDGSYVVTLTGSSNEDWGATGLLFGVDGVQTGSFQITDDFDTFAGYVTQVDTYGDSALVVVYRDRTFRLKMFDAIGQEQFSYDTEDGISENNMKLQVLQDGTTLFAWEGRQGTSSQELHFKLFDANTFTDISDKITLASSTWEGGRYSGGLTVTQVEKINDDHFGISFYDRAEGKKYFTIIDPSDPEALDIMEMGTFISMYHDNGDIITLTLDSSGDFIDFERQNNEGLVLSSNQNSNVGNWYLIINEDPSGNLIAYSDKHSAYFSIIDSQTLEVINHSAQIDGSYSQVTSSISPLGDIILVGTTPFVDDVERRKFQAGPEIIASDYTLTIDQVDIHASITSSSINSLDQLITNLKAHPNYDPDSYTISRVDDKIKVSFLEEAEQVPVTLKNSDNHHFGTVREVTAGINNGASLIDLTQMQLKDEAYVLKVGNISLTCVPPNGAAHTVASLLTAFKNDPDYSSANFTLTETGGNLSVTFDDPSSPEDVILSNLTTQTVDLTAFSLEDETYNLRIGSDILSVEPTGEAPYTITSLINGFEADSDFDISAYSLSEVSGKLVITFNGLSDIDVTFDNAGLSADATSFNVSETAMIKDTLTIASSKSAKSAILAIDQALETLNFQRSMTGSIIRRIDHVIANNTNVTTNITGSIGRINDTDYALETVSLTQYQVLQNASTAILAQANASIYEVLALIPE